MDRLATTPLIFGVYPEGKKAFLRVFTSVCLYYLIVTVLIVFMAKNLLITQFAKILTSDWQYYLLGLSLGFLPRVIRLASGVIEKTRSIIISILTPLALMALPMMFLNFNDVNIPTEEPYLIVLGSLFFTVFGDFTAYMSIHIGLLKPELNIETVGMTNLRRTVESERTLDFSNLVKISNIAVERNRIGDMTKILDALEYAVELAEKRRNQDLMKNILLALQELNTLDLLYLCANSYLNVVDDEFRGRTEEAFRRYASMYQFDKSDTKQLRLLLGRNSYIRTFVAVELAKYSKMHSEGIAIIRSLYEDSNNWVKLSLAEAFFYLSEYAPDVLDEEILLSIGQVEDEHAIVMAAAILERLAERIPEKVYKATKYLLQKSTGLLQEALVPVVERAERRTQIRPPVYVI